MEGWIKLHRKIFDNADLFGPSHQFTRAEAWIWMLCNANFAPRQVCVGVVLQEVCRGQLLSNERHLAHVFGWSRAKLRSFLKLLEKQTTIKLEKDREKTVITILNYDRFQGSEADEKTTKEPQTRPQKDHKKTTKEPLVYKNEKKEKKVKNINTGASDFELVIDSSLEPARAEIVRFLNYRRELGKPYKSKSALTALLNAWAGRPDALKASIEQTIKHQWQGLFEVKSNGTARPQANNYDRNMELLKGLTNGLRADSDDFGSDCSDLSDISGERTPS